MILIQLINHPSPSSNLNFINIIVIWVLVQSGHSGVLHLFSFKTQYNYTYIAQCHRYKPHISCNTSYSFCLLKRTRSFYTKHTNKGSLRLADIVDYCHVCHSFPQSNMGHLRGSYAAIVVVVVLAGCTVDATYS